MSGSNSFGLTFSPIVYVRCTESLSLPFEATVLHVTSVYTGNKSECAHKVAVVAVDVVTPALRVVRLLLQTYILQHLQVY